MKFRAKLVDIGCIHQFTKVLTTISKISKSCALRLTPNQVILTLSERVVTGGTSLWCELNQADFFDEYRIEGKDENNEIYLEVINENLVRAMRSGQNAQSIKIKLTKKQTPCLTFEIVLPSLTSHTRSVTHDVPVAIIPSRFWEDYQKPCLPSYDIKLFMPQLKNIKNIVERMKNLSGYIVLSAANNGVLTFKVETEDVTATTYFKNMVIEHTSGQDTPPRGSNERVEARVDIQRLVTFLHTQQFNPSRVLCGIVHNTAIHMFMQSDDVFLQYFIPAVNI